MEDVLAMYKTNTRSYVLSKIEEYGYQYVFVTIQDMGNSWKIRGEWWDAKYKGGN